MEFLFSVKRSKQHLNNLSGVLETILITANPGQSNQCLKKGGANGRKKVHVNKIYNFRLTAPTMVGSKEDFAILEALNRLLQQVFAIFSA